MLNSLKVTNPHMNSHRRTQTHVQTHLAQLDSLFRLTLTSVLLQTIYGRDGFTGTEAENILEEIREVKIFAGQEMDANVSLLDFC